MKQNAPSKLTSLHSASLHFRFRLTLWRVLAPHLSATTYFVNSFPFTRLELAYSGHLYLSIFLPHLSNFCSRSYMSTLRDQRHTGKSYSTEHNRLLCLFDLASIEDMGRRFSMGFLVCWGRLLDIGYPYDNL